jgi:hypothetical protein
LNAALAFWALPYSAFALLGRPIDGLLTSTQTGADIALSVAALAVVAFADVGFAGFAAVF